jgi:hypothetical protein
MSIYNGQKTKNIPSCTQYVCGIRKRWLTIRMSFITQKKKIEKSISIQFYTIFVSFLLLYCPFIYIYTYTCICFVRYVMNKNIHRMNRIFCNSRWNNLSISWLFLAFSEVVWRLQSVMIKYTITDFHWMFSVIFLTDNFAVLGTITWTRITPHVWSRNSAQSGLLLLST